MEGGAEHQKGQRREAMPRDRPRLGRERRPDQNRIPEPKASHARDRAQAQPGKAGGAEPQSSSPPRGGGEGHPQNGGGEFMVRRSVDLFLTEQSTAQTVLLRY